MLVLTRKLNEEIQIGEDIEIKIVGIDGDQIKIGISAPKEIDVHRKEVYLDIQKENQAATKNKHDLLHILKNQQKNT